jgi:cytidylate kinase
LSRVIVIAVDGPVASGKGTLARRLAAHYGLRHLDSGLLYRATAARLLEAGDDPADDEAAAAAARALEADDLARPNLRSEAVGRASSVVAAIPAVREAVLSFQRTFGAEPPGAVIDGRDIGTVVFPDATLKFFLTASEEARVERRYLELVEREGGIERSAVARDLAERDRRDSERAVSPLRRAEDAVLLDTSDMDADQAFEAACALVDQRLNP